MKLKLNILHFFFDYEEGKETGGRIGVGGDPLACQALKCSAQAGKLVKPSSMSKSMSSPILMPPQLRTAICWCIKM
jgi:hypothetical protein